jgi:malate synthase
MDAYSNWLFNVAIKEVFAIGGMAAQIPIKK